MLSYPTSFLARNAHIDLVESDLHDPATLSTLDWQDTPAPTVLPQLRAYQRILRVTPNTANADALLGAGYESAHAITASGRKTFVDAMAGALGGTAAAAAVYDAAAARGNQARSVWAVAHGLVSPHFEAAAFNQVHEEVTEYFAGLPGYQDFFGSLNYCDCAECESILGPAAYFVDLMRVIDKNVTQQNAATIPPGMKLADRRPDLGKIELSCEATNHMLPYVNLVNDRLAYILAHLGKGEALYQAVAEAVFPFRLPFHLPLERIRASLDRFSTSLDRVYELMGVAVAAPAALAQARIGVSPQAWALLTTPVTDVSALAKIWNVADLSKLSDFETFLDRTSLLVLEAVSLFQQDLSQQELEAKLNLRFVINQGQSTAVSVTDGKVAGLTPTVADRISRFVRLASRLGWDFKDLDWAIRCAHGGDGDLDASALTSIAGIRTIVEQHGLPLGDVLAMVGDLRTTGVGDGASSLAPFDQIFNGPGTITPYRPRYAGNPLYTDNPIPWQIGGSDAASRTRAAWLAGGLRIRQSEVATLVVGLKLGTTTLDLTVEHLSALYRHARVAAAVGLAIEQYPVFLELFGWVEGVFTVATLEKLLATRQVLKRSRLNVYDLAYIATGADDSPYVRPPYRREQLADWFKGLATLLAGGSAARQLQRLLKQLASLLHSTDEVVAAALEIVGDAHPVATFTGDRSAAEARLAQLGRVIVLTNRLRLSTADLASLERRYRFPYDAPTILDIFLFKDAQRVLADPSSQLNAYLDASGVDDAAAVLAGFLRLDEAFVAHYLGNAQDQKVSWVGAMRGLIDLDAIATATGADGAAITALAALPDKGTWDAYSVAAEDLLAMVRARHPADTWDQLHALIDGEVQGALRDALVALALVELQKSDATKWVETERNLYEYLLTDIEMGGCQQVSQLKEGLNALQLYLHRCRLRLEPGVEELPIAAEWWEWLGNYRIWQANRKIFLYPENYLQPSIRQTKSTPFRQLEASLQQGNLDNGAVDGAFRKYLDNFAELAKLVYVEAYYLDLSGDARAGCAPAAGGSATSVFLFARTSNEPYKYYYILHEIGGAWTQWEEVNVTIHADHVTPVYVFDRLFLFWVERGTKKDLDGDDPGRAKKLTAATASIKYSFYDFQKNWVQAQTLMAPTVISVDGSTQPSTFGGLFDTKFFNLKRAVWNRVYCLKVDERAFSTLLSGSNKTEKLVVLFGPTLSTAAHATWRRPAVGRSTANPYIEELETWLGEAADNFAKALALKYNGDMPALRPLVLGNDLQLSSLVDPNEVLFLEDDDPQLAAFPRETIDRASGALFITPTTTAVKANYDADLMEVPPAPSAPTVLVSSAMRNTNYTAFTVKNHPSAFVFQAEREAILLIDKEHAAPSLSRMVYNADTRFGEDSFVSAKASIQAVGSKAVFQQLQSQGYLAANGILVGGTNLASLRRSLAQIFGTGDQAGKQIDVTANILAHTPLFNAASFTDPPLVTRDGSQAAFNYLVSSGYLDVEGRLTADTDFAQLTADLMTQLADRAQVQHIVTTLYQTRYPVALGLAASQTPPALDSYKLDAHRLTTAAVERLSSSVFVGGHAALLSLGNQQIPPESAVPFSRFKFAPEVVTAPDALDGDQVDFQGAYSTYYWELFFHAPQLIAEMLTGESKYADAAAWLNYVFDPTAERVALDAQSFLTSTLGETDSARILKTLTDAGLVTSDRQVAASVTRSTDLTRTLSYINADQRTSVLSILLNHKVSSATSRFWQFQPFRTHVLETLRDQLTNAREINAYHCHPFDPHAIAKLRIGAYEKSTVMRVIDNLLAWGDSLFRQYTWESITTATLYYVYAWNLLGPRPQDVGRCKTVAPMTYDQMAAKYQDGIPEFLISLEHLVGPGTTPFPLAPFNELDAYFCAPENEEFAGYWDRVADRLSKIRHCLNIDGERVPLPLFEPPVDPLALARAAGAGADVLALFGGGAPIDNYYRYQVLADRARTYAGTVAQFGGSLLDALEKKDAAALDMLRSKQERAILKLITTSLEHQLEEQEALIEALNERKKTLESRQARYADLIDNYLSPGEIVYLSLQTASTFPIITAGWINAASIPAHLVPTIFGFADGDLAPGHAVEAGAKVAETVSELLKTYAEIAKTSAEWWRRQSEWQFEKSQVDDDIEEAAHYVAAGEARRKVLEQEALAHERRIAQAEDLEAVLTSKFTRGDLYQWMISRLATVYYQAYQLALDTALKAQSAYQFELSSDRTFIEFDYWDALHSGLTAAEGLLLSLDQLDSAYLQQNVPLMQLEKQVSLLHLDPVKFVAFKSGVAGGSRGTLDFSLKEDLFDLDFPSHYDRKIKAVSLTFVGSGLSGGAINATLAQTNNQVVLEANADVVSLLRQGKPSPKIRSNWLPHQSVALSKQRDDAGLFVLDFRFPDDQFYPFEGTGAVSAWTLTVPPENNRIELEAIADIVVKVWYTAKDGGTDFGGLVKELYTTPTSTYPAPLGRVVDLRAEANDRWQAFLTSPTDGRYVIATTLSDRFALPSVADFELLRARVVLEGAAVSGADFLQLGVGGAAPADVPITDNTGVLDLGSAVASADKLELGLVADRLPAALTSSSGNLDPAALRTVIVMIEFASKAT